MAVILKPENVAQLVFFIRGEKVMLDADLAKLYGVTTKALNQAMRRNRARFPEDFAFRLSGEEFDNLRSQIVTTSKERSVIWSQIVTTSQKYRRSDSLPVAFTEQGVAMLSGVLNSDKAINMNIAIMRAFVEIRRLALKQNDLKIQLEELKHRLGEHDAQLNSIYDAIENLLDEKTAQRKWDERERIGFKK